MATYRLSKVFGSWPDALQGVITTSRSLAQSDFSLMERAEGIAEAFTIASTISNRAAAHGRRPLCIVEPLLDGGSWRVVYSTASRTNTVQLTVNRDGTVQAEYEVLSSNSANESTAVKSFLAAGWTPSSDLASQLSDAVWKEFISRFPEAENDPPFRGHFGRPPF